MSFASFWIYFIIFVNIFVALNRRKYCTEAVMRYCQPTPVERLRRLMGPAFMHRYQSEVDPRQVSQNYQEDINTGRVRSDQRHERWQSDAPDGWRDEDSIIYPFDVEAGYRRVLGSKEQLYLGPVLEKYKAEHRLADEDDLNGYLNDDLLDEPLRKGVKVLLADFALNFELFGGETFLVLDHFQGLFLLEIKIRGRKYFTSSLNK